MRPRFVAVFVLLLSVPALAATRTWTGAASANWSDPNNWSPAGIPSAADALVFGSAARTSMVNDLPSGTNFGRMSFSAPFSLSGNALTLTGSIAGSGLSCSANLKIGASPLTIAGNAFTGAIDVNGSALTLDAVNSVAALNGSGTIDIHQPFPYVTEISGSGSFIGTITGDDVTVKNLSLPNTTFAVSFLRGDGTTGPVSIDQVGTSYSAIEPSATYCNGLLSTGSLTVNSIVKVALCPGIGSDLLHVTGSVTLGAQATLEPFILAGAPTLGQTFTVIDNDGTEPINGTFSGLPEGATVSTGMGNARITYRGGDGNDVALTIASASKNWTGAVSGNWSDPNNWSPAAIPTPAETLLFPAAGRRRTMNDDLPPGTSVGPMIFGDAYTLNGNALTLTGSVSDNIGPVTISNDVKIGAALTLKNIEFLSGSVDVNGQELTVQNAMLIRTLNGSGSVTFPDVPGPSISGTGNFSGMISGGLFLDGGSLPNATFTGVWLAGAGTIGGPVSVSGYPQAYYSGLRPTATSCCAVINSGSLVLNAPLQVKLYSGGVADRIHVTGSVTLGPQSLVQFPFPSGPSAPGDEWVIIDNDDTDAVNGTFRGTPEATMFDGPPWPWGFTYKGGDGNDVAIFRAARTTLALTQSSPATRYGEPVTFTATITGEISGVPTGVVRFSYDPSTTAVVQNGTATWTTSRLPVGTNGVSPIFFGDKPWFYSDANVSHVVLPANTTTTVTVTSPSITYGDTSHFTANLGVVAPGAGTPTGTLSMLVDGAVVRTATVSAGSVTFDLPLLAGGTHAISAAYSGDGNFNPSTSPAAQQVVKKGATTLSAAASPDPVYEGEPAGITAVVRTPNASTIPSGTVAASESGHTLASATLTNGAAAMTLGLLPMGGHTIDVAYAGGASFQSASAVVQVTVLPPAIVASDVTTSGDAPHGVTIPLTLSAPMSLPASVDFVTADGTARAGSAYVEEHGAVTFPAGATSASISVDIARNPLAAPLTFTIRLSNAVNASLPSPTITVTIAGSGVATSYTFAPGLSLDLYAPPTQIAGGAPLILAIPGTTAYDSAAGAIAALRETARGYAVARVAYRPSHVAPFPAQLDDLAAAVAWIRANASTLNVDPNRIGAWGYGTGGHLAALLATSNAHLSAVVEVSGATDLPDLNNDALACSTIDHNAATSAESSLLGCAIPACGGAALDASPLHHVTSSAAATMIIHGGADCVIGPQQAMRLFDALRNAGVYTFLRIVPAADHEDGSGTSATANEIDAFLDVHLNHGGARTRPAHH